MPSRPAAFRLGNLAVTLLASCLAAPLRPSAATFFVQDQTGSDSAAGNSAAHPWKTLAKAGQAPLQPGDSLLFQRGGRWTGELDLRVTGSAAAPICIGAYGEGDAPIFENPSAGTRNAINLSGSWLIVQDLLVRNVFRAGVNIGAAAAHNHLRNLEVTLCGLGVYVSGPDNRVTDSYFHDLTMVVNTPGGNDDNGAVGVVMAASRIEVAYCRFYKCQAPSFDYGTDGGGVEIWADQDITGVYVHHNRAYQCDGFFEIGGTGHKVDSVRVAYNELADCFGNTFLFVNNSGDYAVDVTHYRFENNTVVIHDCGAQKAWALISYNTASPPAALTVRNNLFFVYSADRIFGNVTAPDEDHNLVFHGGAAWFDANFTPAPSDVMGRDPMFVAPGTCAIPGDYRLRPGSPAIDRGADLGYAADFNLGHVPQGAAPDIGAYEFAAATRLAEAGPRGNPADGTPQRAASRQVSDLVGRRVPAANRKIFLERPFLARP